MDRFEHIRSIYEKIFKYFYYFLGRKIAIYHSFSILYFTINLADNWDKRNNRVTE